MQRPKRRGSHGLRKVLVNSETAYRLQVVGLSIDEAATLCSRVKGDVQLLHPEVNRTRLAAVDRPATE